MEQKKYLRYDTDGNTFNYAADMKVPTSTWMMQGNVAACTSYAVGTQINHSVQVKETDAKTISFVRGKRIYTATMRSIHTIQKNTEYSQGWSR